MDAPQDTSLVQWLVNAVVGLGMLAFGWMNFRLNRMEDSTAKDMERMEDETRANAQLIWDRIDTNLQTFDTFRQHVLMTMVTKDDLRETKRELIDAIRDQA